jgi:hypothetical protein
MARKIIVSRPRGFLRRPCIILILRFYFLKRNELLRTCAHAGEDVFRFRYVHVILNRFQNVQIVVRNNRRNGWPTDMSCSTSQHRF